METLNWRYVSSDHMDAFDCISTKMDVREFSSENVPKDVKLKVLEAGRLTGSGNNMQHWRFILVQEPETIAKLAADSTSGRWVGGANFAVIILTDPKLGFHKIDAGRALQDMQLAAWNFGVASRVYTGVDENRMRRDFRLPDALVPTAVLGFGYPKKKVIGRKNRMPLREVAFLEEFGNPLAL